MPYAAAAPVVERLGRTNGREHYLVTVVETGVTGSTNEWSFTLASAGLPRVAMVKAVEVTFSGGSATNVDPEAGTYASGANVYSNGSASASPCHFNPTSGIIWPSSATLYGQSNADGTATTVTTKLLIAEGTD